MKKSILFILVFILLKLAQAQFYPDWTEPIAITDSLSINSNPELVPIMDNFGDDVFSFYEKRLSAGSPSQIWYRNIYTMSGEQLVMGDDIFGYRNPQVLVLNPFYNAKYFLIYESDETGNFDIYGLEFFTNGSFGSSFQLTNTPANENSCYIGEGDYYHTACWETDESILFAYILMAGDSLQFGELDTIDTNNCFDPVCSEKFVFYRKIVSDSSHIYFSEFDNNTNFWTVPDTIFATGNNINLKMGRYMMWDFEEGICWENNGQMLCWDQWSEEVTFLDFQGVTECFEPAFLTYDVITENYFEPAVITFCSGEGETREVYIANGSYSEAQNISNNNLTDSHPVLFCGQSYSYYFNVINTWQTHINDYSVLYMSQTSISYGGISEGYDNNHGQILKASPNPFNNELTIDIYLTKLLDASVYIYSLTGKQIGLVVPNSQQEGWNTCTWKPADGKQNNLPEGVYFVVLKQGTSTRVQKVIYSK